MKLGIDTSVSKAHDSIMNSIEGQLGIYGINPFRFEAQCKYDEDDCYNQLSSSLYQLLQLMSEG